VGAGACGSPSRACETSFPAPLFPRPEAPPTIWRLLREELARGSSVNLAFILGNLLIQLVASLALASYLGPQGVGAFAVGMLVLETSMILVNLPSAAFVREFAAQEEAQALSTVAALKLVLCLPAVAAILVLSAPLAALFGVPATLIATLAFYPPLGAVASVATMVFESRRDMGRRNLPGLTESLGRLTAVGFLVSGASLMATRPESAAVAWTLGAVPAALVALALARFPDLRLAHLGRAREYFSFGWRTSLAHLLQKELLWVGTAAIYLAYIGVSVADAQTRSGLFKVAYSLMFYIVLFGAAVPAMVYPMLSRAFALPEAAARGREVHRLFSLAFFYELIIALPLAGALVLGGPLAFSTVLPAFGPSAPLAQALSLSGVLFCLTLPAATLLPAANRPDLVLRLFVLPGAVALALNVLLVPQTAAPWGGAVGAILADWAAAGVGFAYALVLVRSLGVPPPSFALFRQALSKHPPAGQ